MQLELENKRKGTKKKMHLLFYMRIDATISIIWNKFGITKIANRVPKSGQFSIVETWGENYCDQSTWRRSCTVHKFCRLSLMPKISKWDVFFIVLVSSPNLLEPKDTCSFMNSCFSDVWLVWSSNVCNGNFRRGCISDCKDGMEPYSTSQSRTKLIFQYIEINIFSQFPLRYKS